MKRKLLLLTLVLGVMSLKCTNKDSINSDDDNLIIGSWVDPVYNEEEITFKKSTDLPEEAYGISFKRDGSLVERSSGWCGTPPLVFFDIKGSWEIEGTLIELTKESFPSNLGWRIISLTNNELIIKRELTEREKDHAELMELFNDLSAISLSVSCDNENDWTYTAYGAKACGGPKGFIAYSNKIDTDAFLQKIAVYTNLEKAYNEKWGIVSTCDLPKQPKDVECNNGYPVLKY